MSIAAQILAVAIDMFRPRPTKPVWQWAHEEVYLDEKMTPFPGFYDPELTPYTKFFQEFIQSDEYDECHLAKSSQGGFTEAYLNEVRWMAKNDPGPVIIALDKEHEVRGLCETKLRPTIRRLGPSVVTPDEKDQAVLRLKLRRMTISLGGGNSPALFENKAARFVVLDEAEEHGLNKNPGSESTSVKRGKERTKLTDGKLLVLGKPKLKSGVIWQGYLKGTRHQYFVPCQKCGHMQELQQRGLKFSHCKDLAGSWDLERVRRETRYRCEACGFEHEYERHHRAMIAAGEWRQTNNNPTPRVLSMQISDLYSPMVSWGKIALMIIGVRTALQEQELANHTFGRAYEPKARKVTEKVLLGLRGGEKDPETGQLDGPTFFLGVDPEKRYCPIREPSGIVIGCDTQDDRLKGLVLAMGPRSESYLIDYFDVLDFEDVWAALHRAYPLGSLEADERMEPYGGLLDSGGHRKKEVYEFCWRATAAGKDFFPAKGGGEQSVKMWRESSCLEFEDLPLYHFNDHALKSDLYLRRVGRRATPRVYLPSDIADHPKLMAELLSERMTKQLDSRGAPTYEWKAHGPNDFGDAWKMAHLAWDITLHHLQALEPAL